MNKCLFSWRRIRSRATRRVDELTSYMSVKGDTDLLEISQLIRNRKLADGNLEIIFQRVKPILHRKADPFHPVPSFPISDDLKARVSALVDPEQRILAIVKFRLSKSTKEHDFTPR